MRSVVWQGDFFQDHSFAHVNNELCFALLKRGSIHLSLKIIRNLGGIPIDPSLKLATRSLSNLMNQQPNDPHSVLVRHMAPPNLTSPKNSRWIMMQPWECAGIPKSWVEPMTNAIDEIWAPTNFCKQVYVDNGIPNNKIYVVPYGVNTHDFNPQIGPYLLPTKKVFRFLFLGGLSWRKGIDLLLTAYWKTFTIKDDVSLVIKAHGVKNHYKNISETLIKAIRSKKDGPEIIIIDEELTNTGPVFTACDCLVHPYRGEGFGLPVAEAMACGIPAILTSKGACDDFCLDEHSFKIPSLSHISQLDYDLSKLTKSPWVLEPDIEALCRQMRFCFENQNEVKRRGMLASQWIHNHFTWDHAAAIAEGRLLAV